MSLFFHLCEIRDGGFLVFKRKIRSLRIRLGLSTFSIFVRLFGSFFRLLWVASLNRNRFWFLFRIRQAIDCASKEILRVARDDLLLELEILKRVDQPTPDQVKRVLILAEGRENSEDFLSWRSDRLFKSGDFTEAAELVEQRLLLLERNSVTSGLAGLGARFLTGSFLGHIGHLTILDVVKKAEMLGALSPERRILLLPSDLSFTANLDLIGRWLDHFDCIRFPIDRFSDAVSLLKPISEDVNFIKTADGFEAFSSLSTRINREWEKKQIPSLMNLSDTDHDDLQQLLKALGVGSRSWFVTLHVKHGNPYDSRGIGIPKIDTYFEAIRWLTQQGACVIRMGDPSMSPLPRLEGVVDYAHSPLKSARNDILLFAGSQFGIGTASGPLGVPPLFGRPVLATNYPTLAISQYWPNARMMPIWFSDRFGNRVSFSELSKSRAPWALNRKIVESEYEIVYNSSEDLLAGVKEMVQLSQARQGVAGYQLSVNQLLFEKSRSEILGVDGMSISSTFVDLHPETLC